MSYLKSVETQIREFLPELEQKSPDELAALVRPMFTDIAGDQGLSAASFSERLAEFLNTRIRRICTATASEMRSVWEYLSDPELGHNLERLAIVVTFFAANVGGLVHYPLHEITAMVLLANSILSRKHHKQP